LVKLLGHRETHHLIAFHLAFLDHAHQLNASERGLCRIK